VPVQDGEDFDQESRLEELVVAFVYLVGFEADMGQTVIRSDVLDLDG
jgi:hypothetical protein